MKSHLVMVLPDLHFPYHDPEVLSVVLRTHALLKPERTVILGDWLDAGGFSSFGNESLAQRGASNFARDEIDPCNDALDQLQENTKLLVYIEGNHEFRVEKCAANLGKTFEGIYDLVSPERLLSRDRKGFKWVPYREKLSHYKIADDLLALHGWSHSKYPAARHLDLTRSYSVVFGHVHRQDTAVRRDPITDRIIKAWSPGCLSKLQPMYLAHEPTDWVNGFSLIYVKNDLSRWREFTVTIQDGEAVLPDGRLVSAC